MDPNRAEKRISIEIPPELEAVYANMAVITHTASEVVLDFARILPNSARNRVYARVVMTPMNAKALLRALGTNLEKYEAQFGEIRTADDKGDERPIGFRHD
ncbi:MAG: DUF3467 domain-containing protein [Chloroflexota bacterium]